MSKYTTEVRFICENSAGLIESVGYSNINEVVNKAIPKIFDFEFPIFDETYRNVLCSKILKHYYTREIGLETVGLWKHFLSVRLNEIMPYYNKLYKSELLEFNPLYDFEMIKERRGVTGGTKKDTGSTSYEKSDNRVTEGTGSDANNGSVTNEIGTTTNRWDLYSDTPQGGVEDIENKEYLTNARNITDSDSQTSSGSSENESKSSYDETVTNTSTNSGTSSLESVINNTEEYLETVKGKRSGTSYAKLLKEYRDTFINIDMMIINNLSDLFMNIW